MFALLRQVLRRQVAPRSAEIDRLGEFPSDLRRSFAELGLFALLAPLELGGMGASLTEYCQVIETISTVDASLGLLVQSHGTALKALLLGSSDEQRPSLCRRILDDGLLLGICATEPHAGSDFNAISSRADRCAGGYRLNGRKRFVTNGGVADAYVIFARTAEPRQSSGSHRGITAFCVEAGTAGLSVGKPEEKMGMRGSATSDIIVENLVAPDHCRLGQEGDGFLTFMRTLETSRPAIAAQSVGVAQGALNAALAYAAEPRNGGSPRGEQQAVQFLLADMATQVEVARAFLYQTTRRLDAGESDRAASAMAKLFASDVAARVTADAVQVFGVAGTSAEHPVERMLRDAKVLQIYEGTNQIQRLVIARQLLEQQRAQAGAE
ncbi:MAG: acyl-CoA dehydrogenase family protein [Candidatus Tectomicrobia bacterium]|nr:acyl-CoA dehydrogenase family protein [Candidatus Tectomicrobia bacterium]